MANGAVVQSSALDLLIKSGPTVIVALGALYFMEIQDQRQYEMMNKLLEERRATIRQLQRAVGNCIRVVTNPEQINKLLEGTKMNDISEEMYQLEILKKKYGKEMR